MTAVKRIEAARKRLVGPRGHCVRCAATTRGGIAGFFACNDCYQIAYGLIWALRWWYYKPVSYPDAWQRKRLRGGAITETTW